MEIKGSKMLKVTGILEIIGGGISIISGLFLFAAAGIISSAGSEVAGAEAITDLAAGIGTLLAIVCLVSGAFQLITGVLGVKNNNNPQGAKKCFIWGIISLIVGVALIIIYISAGLFKVTNLLAFVLPGLYTYAAYQVKSQG